ncbi:MAG: RNA 2'-phosphotransferase [Sandaracinaceae bacterium]
MTEDERTVVSKFLSFVLRHRPDEIGLTLDAAGWAYVDELLERCADHGRPLERADLDEVVRTSPKRRFAFSDEGDRIRANQGHSTKVELGYAAVAPPALLFHGTAERHLAAIRATGLQRMKRHHVHLSADEATARTVGARKGKPIVLRVDAAAMHTAGHAFFVTPNGVWLTEDVPPQYLRGLEGD